MLTSKVLKSVPGVAYGHLTLEAMQNWRLSKIDLFVREVIQNCSDAADPVEGNEFFCVEFFTDEFNGKDFITKLDGLNTSIQNRFSDPKSKFLEIRDSGTTGLTGPLTITPQNEKDHGNYYRLVFDTGKAQTQKYSGGNWGYGKSAYYGIGAGFVIYYSQIHEDNQYKSRLIVTLIENEESDDAILRGHRDGINSAGKAWWGKRLDGNGLDANILPLEDEDEIKEILSIFGIKPFQKGQTGTSVIIPYVDYSELMSNMISDEMNVPDDVRNRCSWTFPDKDGFKEYLKLSIQRWYAPAINNSDLPALVSKKWLYATVNGESISYDSMYPFFQLTQRLYTAALAKTLKLKETSTQWNPFYENTMYAISIKNYIDNSKGGNTEVGYLATAKLPKAQVDCGEGSNLDPYLLLGYYEESGRNRPVVMFARRLGMVIDYAYKDEWVHGVPVPEDNDEYVFSFFVPCLGENKRLKPTLSVKKYAGKTLEEYLISCEASDHEGWEDHDRMTIVSSIQGRVIDKIKTLINGDPIPAVGTNADRLGNAFSRMIGISKGKLGKSVPGDGAGSGGRSTSKKLSLTSSICKFGGNEQVLNFKLELKRGLTKAVVFPLLYSDGNNLRCLEWEKDIRTTFPVHVSSVSITGIENTKGTKKTNIALSGETLEFEKDGMRFSLCHESRKIKGETQIGNMTTLISVAFSEPLSENVSIDGSIHIHTLGSEYEYDLVASEEEVVKS